MRKWIFKILFKKQCLKFQGFVSDNYWSGYGKQWNTYQERHKRGFIDPHSYTIDQLFDKYLEQ